MFYSKSNNGFYSEGIHGHRRVLVPDPKWQQPVTDGEPGPAIEPPMIEVDNPACMIPADAVAITSERHAELLAAQAAGQVIGADAQGLPTATLPPAPTASQVRSQAINMVRLQRDPIMNVLDGMQASALVKSDVDKAKAIEAAKQGLKDLTKIDLSDCNTPELCKVKVMTQYKVIAMALPADVRSAFAEALK